MTDRTCIQKHVIGDPCSLVIFNLFFFFFLLLGVVFFILHIFFSHFLFGILFFRSIRMRIYVYKHMFGFLYHLKNRKNKMLKFRIYSLIRDQSLTLKGTFYNKSNKINSRRLRCFDFFLVFFKINYNKQAIFVLSLSLVNK